ncbi:NAD-dependent epimerase/dehydratase family protein [Prosthecochloris ethylica]|uniref:NAD-dependent epimerase/dehydratase family protein n=1 Tax=Prosthecochloris ethylica TaxID=2743976 RepID=UPI0018833E27
MNSGLKVSVLDRAPGRFRPLQAGAEYIIVKVAIERYIRLYTREHDIAATILRPSNAYGPRQGHTGLQGVIGTFLHRAMNDEPIRVWGDGSVIRDYLYVEDLADLCMRCATSPPPGRYLVGHPGQISQAASCSSGTGFVRFRTNASTTP